ncbi:MAG TPA: response regulator transcription factor [Cyclobacteriaceae bacterium]|jgi:DNA-binding response OmpR family regulator|nr:response regulator transcription factor [Cyclobacteriaceae bacterium]
MNRILIVEDEPAMQLGLKDNLELDGYSVDVASDGQEGLEKIKAGNYDLVLLDVMLPKLSGFDVCKAARAHGAEMPIIMLTARGEEIDKVLGLELGADDYITKPFSIRELLARVKAHLRRSKPTPLNASEGIGIGRIKIDFGGFRAEENGASVKLSHKEFEILAYLHQKKNAVVTRYDLLENVWGYQEQPTTRTVDNFIVRLRQKIEENPNQPKVILTVHGTGYKLVH